MVFDWTAFAVGVMASLQSRSGPRRESERQAVKNIWPTSGRGKKKAPTFGRASNAESDYLLTEKLPSHSAGKPSGISGGTGSAHWNNLFQVFKDVFGFLQIKPCSSKTSVIVSRSRSSFRRGSRSRWAARSSAKATRVQNRLAPASCLPLPWLGPRPAVPAAPDSLSFGFSRHRSSPLLARYPIFGPPVARNKRRLPTNRDLRLLQRGCPFRNLHDAFLNRVSIT